MKRILIPTFEFAPLIGGVGTYGHQMALAAHNLGHEVTVMAPDFGRDLAESDRERYPFRVVRYRCTGLSMRQLPAYLWRTWLWGTSSSYDLIHAIDWAYLVTFGLLNKLKQVPFVATVYGSETLRAFDSKALKRRIERQAFNSPTNIFAISEFTRTLLLDRCEALSPDKVTVTPPGVNPEAFTAVRNGLNIRDTYSIPRNHKIILTVSRLDERKGHRTVLKALATLPEELKRTVTYVVVGSFITGGDTSVSYPSELRQLAGESGVKVVFTGGVPNNHLKPLYAETAIFCMTGEPHPMKVEGFGLVYLEAAAQGVPSIGSRIGGVPEAVLHEKTGLLIEPGDVSQLVKCLSELLSNETKRIELGNAARSYARTFTWERCAEQTYGL